MRGYDARSTRRLGVRRADAGEICMPRSRRAALAGLLTAAAALAAPAGALALPHSSVAPVSSRPVCSSPTAGRAACDALLATTSGGAAFNAKPSASSTVAGYHPSDLLSAYNLPSGGGSGQTVAIVDAYNDPNVAADLATYRSQFGLPAVSTCSVASGRVSSPGGPCFVKVSQTGSTTSLPTSNGGWAQEISLDVDMVSAICNQLQHPARRGALADHREPGHRGQRGGQPRGDRDLQQLRRFGVLQRHELRQRLLQPPGDRDHRQRRRLRLRRRVSGGIAGTSPRSAGRA